MWIRKCKKEKSEVSINEALGTDREGNEISFNDILFTDGQDISENLELKMDIDRLKRAIDLELKPREKVIIIKRFGLDGREPQTQREVAETLKISRSYVSRIEKKALTKLRKAISQ